jgi:hypothetical protein
MNRFGRYKALRRLWTAARRALSQVLGPRQLDMRLRSQHGLREQFLVRQTLDGVIRTTGDPDSVVRPQRDADRELAWQAEQRQRAGRQWYEAQRQQRARGGK